MLEKFIKKDSNEILENVLAQKDVDERTKNLLQGILYKIDVSYKDYQNAKVIQRNKKEYVDEINKNIKRKCNKIVTVSFNEKIEEETIKKSLEKNKFYIDENQIITYPIEEKILYAIEKSINNKELFLNLVYIMNTSVEGGSYRSLVGTPDGIEKIEKFIQTLRKVSFEKEKLVGFIILYRMLKYIPKEVLESSFKEKKYSELKTETDEYLKKNYTAKNMEEILETENEFFLLDYAIDNKKKFMIDLLRKKYLSNIYNYNFLNLIFE